MPRNSPAPGSPGEWLARARGDLALARVPLPEGGFYEDLCFHAQQAAEKALKAVYLSRGWTFRYIHDLEELFTDLQAKGLSILGDILEAVILTDYAFDSRYPRMADSITDEEYRKAITLAEQVLGWAEAQMKGAQG